MGLELLRGPTRVWKGCRVLKSRTHVRPGQSVNPLLSEGGSGLPNFLRPRQAMQPLVPALMNSQHQTSQPLVASTKPCFAGNHSLTDSHFCHRPVLCNDEVHATSIPLSQMLLICDIQGFAILQVLLLFFSRWRKSGTVLQICFCFRAGRESSARDL